MLPIANKPMLMYGFDQMRAAGIKEIGVILGPLQEGIVDALGDGSKYNVKITYIDQPDPKGIAHAVLISRGFLGDSPFVVHLGDNLLKDSVPELGQEFLKSDSDATVVLTKVKDPSRFGVVQIQNGKIVKLVEKPKQYISDLALARLVEGYGKTRRYPGGQPACVERFETTRRGQDREGRFGFGKCGSWRRVHCTH